MTATYNDQHKIIAFVLTASVAVCIILYCVIFAGLVKRANLPRSRTLWQGEPEGKLVIHSALYGAGEITDVPVTDRLNAAVRDALVIPVNNNLISGSPDPAPNHPKRLEVTYSYGNPNRHTVSRPEHARLVLPEDSEIQRLGSELQRLTHQLAAAKASVVIPAKPSIEILAPLNRTEVGVRRIVIGSVQSPFSPVQVLVFAVDRWYLQGAVAVDGLAWNVDCQFGNEQSGLGKSFQIIAIVGGNIRGGPFLSLPATGVKSEVVSVRRTH